MASPNGPVSLIVFDLGGTTIRDRGEVIAAFAAALHRAHIAAADLAFAIAAATFAQLKTAGMRLALNSGFDRDVVDQVLASVDWPANTFDAVVCAGDVSHGRPAPDMIALSMSRTGIDSGDRVAVVGDTRRDLEAGWRAGAAYRIGVLSGAHDRATLEQGPYTHIVADCTSVPAICIGQR